MKQQPTEPTVTLAEACQRLGIDYTKARLVLSVARRTAQGWVVAVSDLPQLDSSPYNDDTPSIL